jgi:hypothetical protein
VEAAALLLAAGLDTDARAAAYAWLAVVCWRAYDNVYRLRETGQNGAAWLRRTSGVEVRIVVLSGIGGSLAAPAVALGVGALVLAVLSVGESVVFWRQHLGRKARQG